MVKTFYLIILHLGCKIHYKDIEWNLKRKGFYWTDVLYARIKTNEGTYRVHLYMHPEQTRNSKDLFISMDKVADRLKKMVSEKNFSVF